MFVVFAITGVFSYFYHIFIGRVLGAETYGEFGALFSLSFFLQFILFKMINVIVSRPISKFKGQKKFEVIPFFHSKMMSYMAIAGVIGFLIFLVLSVQIASFLHINSIVLVLLIGVIFLLCWLLPVNSGTMQGLQRFKNMGFLNVVQSALRFIIGVGLVLFGFGIYGAVGGLVIGTVISLVTSFYLLRDIVKWPFLKSSSSSALNSDSSQFSSHNIDFEIKETFRFTFPVFLTIVCIAIPTNIDVVLVKHFFTAQLTGQYTAVSVFGRMMFSIPIAITTVMYPKVVEAYTTNNGTRSLLNKSLLYTVIPLGFSSVLFYFFPNFFLNVFFGKEYLEGVPLLQLYGAFIFFFSITTILAYNSLAKHHYGFIYLFSVFSVLELGLVCIFHHSLHFFLQIFLSMNAVLMVIGLIINYSNFNDEKNSKNVIVKGGKNY